MIKKFCVLILGLLILSGCSHTIQLSPNLDNIRDTELSRKIDKNVGYYISSKDLNNKVTTPGGGGDDVEYQPYKDTEAVLNTILSKIFNKVYSIEDLSNVKFLTEKNISYVFKPTIKTDSSSSSAFTWPPTEFKFELTCSAINSKGAKVWQKTVSATGNAEYDEFKDDFSLSARRASDKAFQKMMIAISKAKQL